MPPGIRTGGSSGKYSLHQTLLDFLVLVAPKRKWILLWVVYFSSLHCIQKFGNEVVASSKSWHERRLRFII